MPGLMSKKQFAGIGVAFVTPFKQDKSIDFPALTRVVDSLLAGGIDYIVALGTTAETPTLSGDERTEVVRAVVKQVAGRIPVVMGVGGNHTAELVHTLKTFDFDGVSAILSVTPYYNKPTQEGLFQHYLALAEASPLPVILYNVPSRTGVNMDAETTLRIARACRSIIGIKEASGDIDQAKEIISHAPDGFSVISGDDAMTLPVIRAGGDGVISVLGNALPQEFGEVVRQALHGDFDGIEQKGQLFAESIRLLFCDGNPAGIKAMLHCKGLIDNVLRLPLVPVSPVTMEKIRQELNLFQS